MKITETHLKGCYVLEPILYEDPRGYFFESFNRQKFAEATGQDVDFVQDNESLSVKGVLRGLHYQRGDWAQAKLVRVIHGAVWDVAMDIRPKSPTFGQWHAVELSAENKKQVFIPRGFAHGFVVLSETALFYYKCDNYYNKASEGGILYNDPELDIDWKLPQTDFLLSDKDRILPPLKKAGL